MSFDPHLMIILLATIAAGWLMTEAGIQKSALEQRRRRRICPSCGREIQRRVCTACSSV